MMDVLGIGAAANAISTVADAAKGIIDTFFPDKTEQEKAQLAMQMQDMMNQYNLVKAQTDINLVEAQSTSWFVAGWRPFIGWVCGTGLGYQFLFMPIMNGILAANHVGTPFVSLDVGTLTTCLTGLLGLASLRTFEKHQDVEKNR
jgi:hypothetical protein